MKHILLILMVLAALSGCSNSGQGTTLPDLTTESVTAPPPVVDLPDTATASPAASSTPRPTQKALPTETVEPEDWIAFIDPTGNLALVDAFSGAQQILTEDAAPYSIETPEAATNTYCCAAWSSDGHYLSFWQEIGDQASTGYQVRYRLQVMDLSSREITTLLENQVLSAVDWRPGAYEISIDSPIPPEYFLENREEYASGIDVIDIRTGERRRLVAPENGLALAGPQWSADGSVLTFSEIQFMEGSGQFAWYDFTAGQYHSTGEILGETSLSPDGKTIVYDRLAYLPTGNERVWIRPLSGGDEQQISTEPVDGSYAFSPHFSPDGRYIAYFTAREGLEEAVTGLHVVALDTEDAMELGDFERAGSLSWSPDGRYLVLAAGMDENRTIVVVDVEDGTAREFVRGREPAWWPVGDTDRNVQD